MPVSFWTDLNISRLKILWADGYSATVVAQELGCTRNAVVGKIDRLNLPNPAIKQAVARSGLYARQLSPQTLESRRLSQIRRRERDRAKRREQHLKRQRDVIWLAEEKEETRQQFRARGSSPYSAAYRKHMPRIGEMTKGELREMLAQAMQNTAAMQ